MEAGFVLTHFREDCLLLLWTEPLPSQMQAGRWPTQAGFAFSHSTPVRALLSPTVDYTTDLAVSPQSGGCRQALYCGIVLQGGNRFLQLRTEPLTCHHTQVWLPSSPGVQTGNWPQSEESPTVRDTIPLSLSPRSFSCPDMVLHFPSHSFSSLCLCRRESLPSVPMWPFLFPPVCNHLPIFSPVFPFSSW